MNISYQTDELAGFYRDHRACWSDFYPSERWIFERIAQDPAGFGRVLDIGCAAGGLGLALAERVMPTSYTGVEINRLVLDVARARRYPMPARFVCADVLDCAALGDDQFDTVFSLSVADWNVETDAILRECWRRVAPGGRFVLSLRLTPQAGIKDIARSHQYIWFNDDVPPDAEVAPYVVFNTLDALETLRTLAPAPAGILGYGYWGPPSATARTPYRRVVFTVFAVYKPEEGETAGETRTELHLPATAWSGSTREAS